MRFSGHFIGKITTKTATLGEATLFGGRLQGFIQMVRLCRVFYRTATEEKHMRFLDGFMKPFLNPQPTMEEEEAGVFMFFLD